MHQQLAPTLGADTGNFFQFALIAFFTSARTMAGYCKPMCLVTYMLQQVARFRTPIDHYFRFTKKEPFFAGYTFNTLCDTKGFNRFDLQLLQYG
jgi:hypothetical protein